MSNLAFYAEVATTGRLAGLGPGSASEDIEETLGTDYIEQVHKHWMRRDYGIVEFHFNRVEGGWICFGMTIQVHRLADAPKSLVPPALGERYGMLSHSVSLTDLVDAIASGAGNSELIDIESSGEFSTFKVRGTDTYIQVIRPSIACEGEVYTGAVWSIEVRSRTRQE